MIGTNKYIKGENTSGSTLASHMSVVDTAGSGRDSSESSPLELARLRHMRQMVQAQEEEFQRQVVELHRLMADQREIVKAHGDADQIINAYRVGCIKE
jgi:hypothetical protein